MKNNEKIVEKSEALDHIFGLKKFFAQKNDNLFNEELDQMQRKVIEYSFDSLKQQKITDFFSNNA